MNSKKNLERSDDIVEQFQENKEKFQLTVLNYLTRHSLTVIKLIGAMRFAGH